MAIKIQSAWSVAITKHGDPTFHAKMAADAATGGGYTADDIFDMYNARTSYKDIKSGETVYLEVGEDIKPISAAFQSNDFTAFQLSQLDSICSVIGIPVEEVVGGYRNANYSSARGNKITWRQTIDYVRNDKEQFLDKLQRHITEVYSDHLPAKPADESDDVMFNWPVVEDIDAQRAALTQISLYNAGLRSKAQIANEAGLFSDQMEKQLVEEAGNRVKLIKAKADELGVSFEVIQSQMSGNGVNIANVINGLTQTLSPEVQNNSEKTNA